MLFEFIILIAPALLAAFYICVLRNIAVKSLEFLIFTVIFAFLINVFVLGISYLRGYSYSPVGSLYDNIGVAFKHCVLSLLAAVTLPNTINVAINLLYSQNNDSMKGKDDVSQDK